MKKLLSLLLLCTSLSSSYTAYAPRKVASSASIPVGNPIALWQSTPNKKVMLGYFQTQPEDIYIRVEDEENAKTYQSALNRVEALKALKEGTFAALYQESPTHESVMQQHAFLNSKVSETFLGKNTDNSPDLATFCDKVNRFYARIQAQLR